MSRKGRADQREILEGGKGDPGVTAVLPGKLPDSTGKRAWVSEGVMKEDEEEEAEKKRVWRILKEEERTIFFFSTFLSLCHIKRFFL